MEDLAKLLRAHGLKATRLRLMVLEMLKGTKKSFSASEMEAQFGHKEDRVTIYRIFGDFSSRGIVERFIDIDGVARYVYHADRSALHPHFRCRNCGIVHGLPELPKSYMESMRDHLVDNAVLIFSGTCAHCMRQNP